MNRPPAFQLSAGTLHVLRCSSSIHSLQPPSIKQQCSVYFIITLRLVCEVLLASSYLSAPSHQASLSGVSLVTGELCPPDLPGITSLLRFSGCELTFHVFFPPSVLQRKTTSSGIPYNPDLCHSTASCEPRRCNSQNKQQTLADFYPPLFGFQNLEDA